MFPDTPSRDLDERLAARGLPPMAFVDNTTKVCGDAPVIAVKRGETGFYPIHTRLSAAELNLEKGVTPAQREAMLNGSMFGWDTPGADPKNRLVLLTVRDEQVPA